MSGFLKDVGTSLVVQWLRLCSELTEQLSQARVLGETCRRAWSQGQPAVLLCPLGFECMQRWLYRQMQIKNEKTLILPDAKNVNTFLLPLLRAFPLENL